MDEKNGLDEQQLGQVSGGVKPGWMNAGWRPPGTPTVDAPEEGKLVPFPMTSDEPQSTTQIPPSPWASDKPQNGNQVPFPWR